MAGAIGMATMAMAGTAVAAGTGDTAIGAVTDTAEATEVMKAIAEAMAVMKAIAVATGTAAELLRAPSVGPTAVTAAK
jgi:hypothetical protein